MIPTLSWVVATEIQAREVVRHALVEYAKSPHESEAARVVRVIAAALEVPIVTMDPGDLEKLSDAQLHALTRRVRVAMVGRQSIVVARGTGDCLHRHVISSDKGASCRDCGAALVFEGSSGLYVER